MSPNKFFLILTFIFITAIFGHPAHAKIDMMSDASILAYLSQSLGGDVALANVAWEGMDEPERQKVRESAARLLKISETAKKKYDTTTQDIIFQVEWFRASLLAELFAAETAKTADLSERALLNFYENNKTLYEVGAKVHFRQIVCATKPDAEKVRRLLSSPTTNFGTIAKDVSIDPSSAIKNGDMGWIAKDKLPASFAKKLFETEINRISEPFMLGNSWIIFQVLERENGGVMSFEQVRDRVRIDLISSLIKF